MLRETLFPTCMRSSLTALPRNFAGIIGPMNPIAELSADDFQKCMAVNSTGVLISTKYELKQMMTQSSIEVEEGRPPQQGAIVNCASINSMFSLPGTVAYTASKHAVNGITKAVSTPLRPAACLLIFRSRLHWKHGLLMFESTLSLQVFSRLP